MGAGPLTIIGKLYRGWRPIAGQAYKGWRPEIVAIDPLADKYDLLLAKHHITPLVRTEPLEAEKLTTRFARGTFDICYAENSLDHSYDPAVAIEEMLAVAKPGGVVILLHHANVGSMEAYIGLHQWNFSKVGQDFLISSPGRATINISERCNATAATNAELWPDGRLLVVMTKL